MGRLAGPLAGPQGVERIVFPEEDSWKVDIQQSGGTDSWRFPMGSQGDKQQLLNESLKTAGSPKS